jgi:hypothetical protein
MGDDPWNWRIDQEYQQYVDDIVSSSSLSEHDVVEQALHVLREDTTLSEDDRFVVERRRDEPANTEKMLENQEEILDRLSRLTGADSESIPNTNSRLDSSESENKTNGSTTLPADASEIERTIDDIAGIYEHDTCIDLARVRELDTYESTVISRTYRYLLPTIIGMLNHELENGNLREPTQWRDLKTLMKQNLDISRGSVYNYRRQLVEKGSIIPHPSIDENVVGDKRLKVAREQAAAVSDKRLPSEIDADEFDKLREERYSDNPGEYLGAFVDKWDRDVYYRSGRVYQKAAWSLFVEGIEGIANVAGTPGSRPGGDPKEMYTAERAAGANTMLVGLAERLDAPTRLLLRVRKEAASVSSEQELGEWARDWLQQRAEIEAELFGRDLEPEEAVDILEGTLDIDVEEADSEEIREAVAEVIERQAPDEIGAVREVVAAKRTLVE